MGAGLANDGLVAFRRAGGGGEGLFLAPDLAVSLPAPTANGRAYTFQVRPGIRYSNGRLVRPADFRRAIERALALCGRQQPGSYFNGIVGAAACMRTPKRCDLSRGITTTTGTVTFHLTGADPAFLYKLALPNPVAEPADTPLEAPLPLPATGPYMYRTFDRKRQIIELVRNPQFRPWSAAARPDGYPDTIRIRFGYGADGAVRAVERGKADLASIGLNNSLGVRTELRIRYRGLLHSNPSLNVGGAGVLNTRIPPFDDQRVGKGVQLCGRSRAPGRAGRRRPRHFDLPVPAAEPRRLPPLLPLHAPGPPRRAVHRARSREGTPPSHRIPHPRRDGRPPGRKRTRDQLRVR
jgi:ABC-type transport system substrate-binding protein